MNYDASYKRVLLVGGPAAGRMVTLDARMMNYIVEDIGKVGAKRAPSSTQRLDAVRVEYWITTCPVTYTDDGTKPVFIGTTEPPGNRNVLETLMNEYVKLANTNDIY